MGSELRGYAVRLTSPNDGADLLELDQEARSEGGLVVAGGCAPTATLLAATLLAAAGGLVPATLLAATRSRGRLATGGTAGRPRVLGLAAGATAPAAALVALAAAEAATAAAALGLVDLRGGTAQGRADLVDVHLHDGALLAFLGLVGPGLQPAGHDHPHAPLARLGNVLCRVAPHRAAHEQRLAVLPLVALAVELPRRRGHGEVRDRGARRRETQLGVGGQVADDRDDGVASHGSVLRRWIERISNFAESGAGAQQLGAHDRLAEVQLAIELLGGGRLRRHRDDDVDALGLLLDVVGEAATAPDVDVVDGAAVVLHDGEELVHRLVDGALFGLRVEDDHEFVLTHASNPPPLVSAVTSLSRDRRVAFVPPRARGPGLIVQPVQPRRPHRH